MRWDVDYCRSCGLDFEAGTLSSSYLCPDCARERLTGAISQMIAHAGPVYEKWKRNYIASLSGVVERLRREKKD